MLLDAGRGGSEDSASASPPDHGLSRSIAHFYVYILVVLLSRSYASSACAHQTFFSSRRPGHRPFNQTAHHAKYNTAKLTSPLCGTVCEESRRRGGGIDAPRSGPLGASARCGAARPAPPRPHLRDNALSMRGARRPGARLSGAPAAAGRARWRRQPHARLRAVQRCWRTPGLRPTAVSCSSRRKPAAVAPACSRCAAAAAPHAC
jgi:hypothetical protein